ncbi:MAG: ATP-binding cassette domain-containing protein [Oscillospiraceae bacterium]
MADVLVGPNGAGKSTLIEAIAGGVPYAGKNCAGGPEYSRKFRASELRAEPACWRRKRGELRLFRRRSGQSGTLCACVRLFKPRATTTGSASSARWN